jgi:hypothetical protein
MIAIAEAFSWYAVLSTSFLGNTLEQSTWTFTAVLIIAATLALRPRLNEKARRYLPVALAFGLFYVAFMCAVDIRMYATRWLADSARELPSLSMIDGIKDSAQRWVLTYKWDDWYEELAWMALYFSAAVWASIGLAHIPAVIESSRMATDREDGRTDEADGTVAQGRGKLVTAPPPPTL